MATKSKVHTVPGSAATPPNKSVDVSPPEQAPVKRKKKKEASVKERRQKQFSVDHRRQPLPQNDPPPKKVGNRRSVSHQQEPPPVAQKTNGDSKDKISSVSARTFPTQAESAASKTSSLSRQLTKEKRTQFKAAERKISSSLDATPRTPSEQERSSNPTPSEGNSVRSKQSTSDRKSRVSSLKSAVNASKNAPTQGKVSSLKAAVASSKLSGAADNNRASRKASTHCEGSVGRKLSPVAQKRKESLKAKNNNKDPLDAKPTKKTLRQEFSLNEAKSMDVSARSASSAMSLPAKLGGKVNRQSALHQNPQLGTKQKLASKTWRRPPQPQSASKPRSQSLNIKKSNMSPKRHSHGKVPNIPEQTITVDLSTGANRKTTYVSKSTKNDLKTRLESQRLLNERYSYNSSTDDIPLQRKSGTSLTFTSMMTLSSTCHKEMITPQRTDKADRVSMSQETIDTKTKPLSSSTSQMSAYAGEIATPRQLAPRSSLAPNMLLKPHQHSQHDMIFGLKPRPNKPPHPKKSGSLTFFGNPLVPIDIVEKTKRTSKLNLMHHKDALQVLGEIKNMKRQQLMVKLDTINSSGALPVDKLTKVLSQPEVQPELKCLQLLKTAGTSTSATLSMTGFKGGALEDQINHDRSLIVSPFYLRDHTNSMVRRRLMGVFDGHAEKGSLFAEHCQQLLPSLLSRKLSEAFKKAVGDIAAGFKTEDEVSITKQVVIDCFLQLDASSPNEASGGCTATVIYQQSDKIFVANTGDSRSCIVVYRKTQASKPSACQQTRKLTGGCKASLDTISEEDDNTASVTAKPVKVVYISREDKPDLPDERSRLERLGGEIIDADKNKSAKVKFNGVRMGKATATLSMSRSIGDSLFTNLGVIADPIVDVIDLKELVEKEKSSEVSSTDDGSEERKGDNIYVFAFCTSDGMMIESIGDAEAVALELAPSLFNDDGPHPLTACHSVIEKSAATWDRRNKGKFRDDITVAITVLRTPPMA